MYIWLRMFFMFFVCAWQQWRLGRSDPWGVHIYRTRAYPNDLDFNVHVNNGRINTLADLGRMHFFVRTGLLRYALTHGARPMVGDITAKYRREIKVFQPVEIHTRVLGWEGKWAFIEHRFYRHDRVIGNVVMRGMFKGKNGPLMPEVLLQALSLDAHHASPTLPDWVLQWHHSMEGMSAALRVEEGKAPDASQGDPNERPILPT